MILECPNCETRYEIPVDLPPEGRKVRCSSCHHVWQATRENQPQPEATVPDFDDEEIVFKEDPEAEAARAAEAVEAAESAEAVEKDAPAPAESDDPKGDDAFSEEAMEEAFSAAMDEAAPKKADSEETSAEPQTEPDIEGGDLVPKRESQPIVIGKAKRRKGSVSGPMAAGWAALVLFVAILGAYAYFQRVDVVRALPGTAPVYERFGLPVNVRGLEFDKVAYSWETNGRQPVLEVHGEIINVTSEPLKVPTVVFGLRTKEKVEVYQWAADVRSELLPARQRTKFSAQIPTPPKSIRDVLVRFAKIR
ncbi:MAG: zinc-ribbon domain-containing protein [Hyphomicrobiaceae bacterium]|nr:zinc-ribbon domain-containing protein [Hyphomicrobiaceae bacterium]